MNDATIDATAPGGCLRGVPQHPLAILTAGTAATPGRLRSQHTLHADATPDNTPVDTALGTLLFA